MNASQLPTSLERTYQRTKEMIGNKIKEQVLKQSLEQELETIRQRYTNSPGSQAEQAFFGAIQSICEQIAKTSA